MRLRRSGFRGVGCLGCLPLGGLIMLLMPLILIGALIYWLVNRQRMGQGQQGYPPQYPPQQYPPQQAPYQAPPQMPRAGGGYCPQCGHEVKPGEKFCAGCGQTVG